MDEKRTVLPGGPDFFQRLIRLEDVGIVGFLLIGVSIGATFASAVVLTEASVPTVTASLTIVPAVASGTIVPAVGLARTSVLTVGTWT